MVKRTLILLSIGIVIGVVLVMVFGPDALAWWNKPIGEQPFACTLAVREASRLTIMAELVVGGAIGLVLAVTGNVMAYKRAKRQQQAAAEAQPQPAK